MDNDSFEVSYLHRVCIFNLTWLALYTMISQCLLTCWEYKEKEYWNETENLIC